VKILKKNTHLYLTGIFVLAIILYWPSLFAFYTNDDFFLLKISNAQSLNEYLGFFNLKSPPEGLGMYRPLAMQSFFMLSWKVFNLNPSGLHLISFVFFFGLIYFVYKIIRELTGNDGLGLLSAFFYATSATHFAHLYWLSVFQELAMGLFFLISVFFYLRFNEKKSLAFYFLSIIFFILSLLSKETAVIIPLIFILVYLYRRVVDSDKKFLSSKLFGLSLLPFFLILGFYFYYRIFYYGFPKGDSYVWSISPRVFNSIFWYGLWSLNFPEMVIDFVGPGLTINPNLFRYWSREIIPILILLGTLILTLVYCAIKFSKKLFFKKTISKYKYHSVSLFPLSLAWFLFSLIPVIFLPLHKFTYYLTIPLIGVVLLISFLLKEVNIDLLKVIVCLVWISISTVTLNLTKKTNWIIQGEKTAKRVYIFFNKAYPSVSHSKTIIFYDTEKDKELPWSPTSVLKTVLSDNNFFEVFYPSIVPYYGNINIVGEKIPSRQFLGY
jgi:hypothetical protein